MQKKIQSDRKRTKSKGCFMDWEGDWRTEDGQVILMGGNDVGSKKTSEVVSAYGNQRAFDLKYETT